MNYISLCDGIGAAHVAFQPLGWQCVGVSEIDPFCNAVVRYHWGFENMGSLTDEATIKKIADAGPQLIIGGTPCQSFSIAGKQRGIKDPNGQLILWFLYAIFRARPKYFVWENVPNVRSIDKGAVLKAFLASLSTLGYCVEWGVLDAQFFGVPQVRERIFVCGTQRGERRPKVFFEPKAMRGNPAKGKKEKQTDQGTRLQCLTAGCRKADRGQNENLIVDGPCQTIGTITKGIQKGGTLQDARSNLLIPTLCSSDGGVSDFTPLTVQTITAGCRNVAKAGKNVGVVNPIIEYDMVRRLTPIECERAMGFPDDYTLVPLRTTKKGRVIMMSDSARYAMIGNSMAVPVLRWVGEKINEVSK